MLALCIFKFIMLGAQGLHWAGAALVVEWGLLTAVASLVQGTGSQTRGLSSCGSRALELGLSRCGAWAYLSHGMWDLPRPGIEPLSPALAGRFLIIRPPGKSHIK